LFRTGSAPGISALRSFLLLKGTRRVSARMNPRTVSPAGCSRAAALGRPTRPRFLGFDPSRSPWRRRRVSATNAGCSLGLLPRRACGSKRRTRFRPCSSHALERPTSQSAGGALEYPTTSTWPRPTSGKPEAGQDNPFRVLAPDPTETFKRTPFGLLVDLTPRRTSLPTAGAP
jgi:hypothetical protein